MQLIIINKLSQVSSEKVTVQDSGGKEVAAQLIPVSNETLRLRNYYVTAYLGRPPSETLKYWLAFTVSVPPIGFSTYVVAISNNAG